MTPKFCFVILHYLNIEDTVACVDSIRKYIVYDNYEIVVVDNGSPNDTGRVIQDNYKDDYGIHVLLNKENLGFARGNNIGYLYARDELHADFIGMINNDTIVKQSDFIDHVVKQFQKSGFHVLGPDIISVRTGRHQNPSAVTLRNRKVVRRYLVNYRLSLLLNYFLLDKVVENLKKKIVKKPLIVPALDLDKLESQDEQKNVKLHGSALIFSPKYLKLYDGLHPGTFIYSEEEILRFIVQRDNLLTVFDPRVKIFHKEDASTDKINTRNYQKRRFYLKNCIRSGKVLLQLMDEENSPDSLQVNRKTTQ